MATTASKISLEAPQPTNLFLPKLTTAKTAPHSTPRTWIGKKLNNRIWTALLTGAYIAANTLLLTITLQLPS